MKSLISAVLLAFTVAIAVCQTIQGTTTVKETSVSVSNYVQKVVPYSNGYYVITESYSDLLIQRYNASGNLVASNFYDSPHGESDYLGDAAIDTAGNLYVAVLTNNNFGTVINPSFGTWYVKFDATITLKWERLIDGLTTRKLLVTPGGLGICIGDLASGTQFNMTAYAANGNLIYSKAVTGIFRDAVLGLDNSAWLVGRTTTSAPRVWRYEAVTGNYVSTWVDSYSASGTEFRVAAIDPNGTFYAAGMTSDDGTDATRKLSILRFTNVFNRYKPVSAPVQPTALRIDATNLYVEVDSGILQIPDIAYVIPKSNPNSTTFNLSADAGNVFSGTLIEGAADRVYIRQNNALRLTSKALVPTTVVNLTSIMGVAGISKGTAAGHIFAYGSSSSGLVGKVQRVNQNGSLGFLNEIGDGGRGFAYPYAHTVDGNGELFVGHSVNGGLKEMKLKRINRAGTILWSTNMFIYPAGIVADSTYVYVAGTTYTGPFNEQRATVKKFLKSTGAEIWTRTYASDTSLVGTLRAVCLTSDGNLAIGGDISLSFTVWKVNAATGDVLWSTTKVGTQCVSLASDAAGAIYAVAYNTYVFRFSASGATDWFQTIDSQNSQIAFDEDANYVLVGSRDGSTSSRFYRITRTTGVIAGSNVYSADTNRMAVAIRADGGADALARNNADYTSAVGYRIGSATSSQPIPGQTIDVKFFGTDLLVLFDGPVIDSNGGFTRKIQMRRYNSSMVLQESKVIEPLGIGLDGNAVGLGVGLQGQFYMLGSLQRRNEGTSMIATRWRHEYAPTGIVNIYSAQKGTTLNVAAPGILGNDTDINGDALTAELATSPSAGTLTLNANGSFTYAAPNTTGSRTFTYRAVDSTGRKSAPITVSISVVN